MVSRCNESRSCDSDSQVVSSKEVDCLLDSSECLNAVWAEPEGEDFQPASVVVNTDERNATLEDTGAVSGNIDLCMIATA